MIMCVKIVWFFCLLLVSAARACIAKNRIVLPSPKSDMPNCSTLLKNKQE